MTKYGLIGQTLGYSFSRGYFTDLFKQLGLTDHHFDNYEFPEIKDLQVMLKEQQDLKGFTVTIPFKEQVIPMLAEMSDAAREIGAVNVVVRKGEQLIGHNTDAIGFELSLKQFIPSLPLVAPAWILGTGGASKAITYVLRKLNQPYKLVSRNPSSSDQLSYEDLAYETWLSTRLIINTTPVGTFPDVDESPPIPLHLLGPQHFIYDLIYNPSETLLLREGSSRGSRTINGLPMLHKQAEAAWQIWQEA
ncbi:MAG: shikimate dehydrogenase [Saprospiraceae bacterium]